MVRIEQAIEDLKEHIEFQDDGHSCTTEGEVIILLERQKSVFDALESDKRKLAEFIIKNWHHCPIPIEVVCECGFKEKGCVECLLCHIDTLNLPKED